MIVYRTKTDLASHLEALRKDTLSIGLVPTMGALHEGHVSLVRRSTEENDFTVVSIFVNPTQFNDPSDLEKYPRTLDDDLNMLQDLHTDVVFVPSVKEMYPQEDQRVFDLSPLDRVMEGKHREGHFNGVAQIVSKLFEAVGPNRAYFGQKDFQQLVIVRRLARMLDLDLEIVSCPIIRETDGLALSSRNIRLTKEERKMAPFIYATLLLAREKSGSLSPGELKAWVMAQFDSQDLLHLEYFEIVDDLSLSPITSWEEAGNKVACLAARLGEVRLIDNLIFD
jgi:pantoate--beta-alanine ligase